jgi:monoamine oxidase
LIDLVIVGGGQAGLAAAAEAAERGLRLVVCEKTSRLGGSAYFSAGIRWTAPDVATLRSLLPDGDPELGRVLVESFEPAGARAREAGVPVSERDRDGAAVRGLHCAGGDAGGLQGPRYVAASKLGIVCGPRAVEAVMLDKEKG